MENAGEEDFCRDALRRIPKCQEPIVYVVSSDGAQRRWMGPTLTGRCGRPYPAPNPTFKMLVCEKCVDNPALGVLLAMGLDPREITS